MPTSKSPLPLALLLLPLLVQAQIPDTATLFGREPTNTKGLHENLIAKLVIAWQGKPIL